MWPEYAMRSKQMPSLLFLMITFLKVTFNSKHAVLFKASFPERKLVRNLGSSYRFAVGTNSYNYFVLGTYTNVIGTGITCVDSVKLKVHLFMGLFIFFLYGCITDIQCYDVICQTKGYVVYEPGPRLNIKTVLSTYGDFHVKDKTAVRTSYL